MKNKILRSKTSTIQKNRISLATKKNVTLTFLLQTNIRQIFYLNFIIQEYFSKLSPNDDVKWLPEKWAMEIRAVEIRAVEKRTMGGKKGSKLIFLKIFLIFNSF